MKINGKKEVNAMTTRLFVATKYARVLSQWRKLRRLLCQVQNGNPVEQRHYNVQL